MVGKYEFESSSSPLLKKILALLAELNKSRQGKIFYKHIKQTLEEWEATQIRTIDTYAGLLNLLLDVFASRLPPESAALTHIKLVQACLTPPHSESELNLLQDSVEQAAEILKYSCHIDADEINDTLTPLLKRFAEPDSERPFPKPTPKEAKKGKDFIVAYEHYGHANDSQAFAQSSDSITSKHPSSFQKRGPFEESSAFKQPTEFDQQQLEKPASESAVERDAGLEDEVLRGDEQVAIDDYDRIVDDISETGDEELIEKPDEAFADSEQPRISLHEYHKPLKAPRAVLKMLRFPENAEREEPETSEAEPADEENISAFDIATDEPGQPVEDSGAFDRNFRDTAPLREQYSVTRDDIMKSQGETEQPAATQPVIETGDRDDDSSVRERDRREMERLHHDFVRQIRSIMAENQEFGVHLGLEIDALDQDTKANDVEERRNAILGSLKKLSDSHAQLAKKFDTAQTYLSIIESDKRKLSDELERARKLSLTDDLTSLPNRRAFMRRMDDEVSRVKRYGFPLSLVLIDIDYFKQVNDEFGHNAGDTVLQVYAEKILSVFRHHDMIARYGGEEFAVLLPNTDLEGVLRALDKVKGTVPEVKCHISGVTISAPTFSAGVAEYHAPETPTQFIERADHALYRAKRLGRDRIEVEHTDHEHGMIDQT